MSKKFLTPVALAVSALLSISPASASVVPEAKVEKISEILGAAPSGDNLVIERATSEIKVADHYSHMSHSSHASHMSHSSHFSSSY